MAWRPHYRGSLAGRVILLTTFAVGLAVTAVALATYVTVRTQSLSTLDDSLRDRAVVASHYDSIYIYTQSQRPVPAIVYGAADIRLILLDLNRGRQVSFGSADTGLRAGPAEIAVAKGRDPDSARTVAAADGERYRMVAVPAGRGSAIILAQSLEPTERMLSRLGLVAIFFGLAGVILAAVAGFGVARSGLRPVRRLTGAAEEIARTEKLDPIPVEGNDEVARLSRAFNAMLGSLSASRDRQRQLVADAGHELRTPLTSLRTNIELLAQAAGSDRLTPESRSDLLDDVKAQISELTTLIGDLVELARDEPMTSAPVSVEMSEVVEAAVARVRRRAPEVQFDVRCQPWWVTGESNALERAVTNLFDNAAKWTPAGGTVTAELRDGTLSVTDEGPGISDQDLPHVFERFYRSAESRAMPGSGLGLSIVAAIAERHGGSVRAGRADGGGAAFWLTLPGVGDPGPEPAATPVASSAGA